MTLTKVQKELRVFLQKLINETVYFKNTYEDAVLRSVPGQGVYVKFKGKDEFLAGAGSAVVTDAKLEGREISQEAYDRF